MAYTVYLAGLALFSLTRVGFRFTPSSARNPKVVTITDRGATFHLEGTERKFNLTPEKSVQLQLSYGSDVIICLDDCTHADDPLAVQQVSVARTVKWARRCRTEFDRLIGEKKLVGDSRPRLVAVVQGAIALNYVNNVLNSCSKLGSMVTAMVAGLWTARANSWRRCWP